MTVTIATFLVVANDIWLLIWAVVTELRSGVRIPSTWLFGVMMAEAALIYAVVFLLSGRF